VIPPPNGPDLASVSSLDDPVRSRLYEFVCRRLEPVGRDEAAAGVGIGRALAVYHLDKLVEAGLLEASHRRPPGRSGPGAGRPAKVYARSSREFAVTVPPREYELAARLLVQAVESDHSGRSQAALRNAAWQLGAEFGNQYRDSAACAGMARQDLEALLSEHGFEPGRGQDGTTRLRNCPFHHLAQLHREVVCGMNLALVEGLVAGLRLRGLRPSLEPQPGQCCVAVRADQP
jgi:predicted ArsR family transcriptional regulator